MLDATTDCQGSRSARRNLSLVVWAVTSFGAPFQILEDLDSMDDDWPQTGAEAAPT